MKTIIIKLWRTNDSKPWAVFPINADGRFSYNFRAIPSNVILSHFTIEPGSENSKVEMTHYGAKYTP